MANQRFQMKPYKGYGITRVNGYAYHIFDTKTGKTIAVTYSRESARAAIRMLKKKGVAAYV